jgi:hypothetical protein
MKSATEPQRTQPEQTRAMVPREQISRLAEQLWRERNCPAGQDDAIWLEAESRLQAQAEMRPASGTESRPNADEAGVPVRKNTKSRDPADAAAQPRSATRNPARGERVR